MNTPAMEHVDVEYERNECSVASPMSDEGCSEVDEVSLTMPPTSDEDEDHEGDTTCIYSPPPPRVAARFYRPTQSRRKESAASSRRNSISSAHSRCSSNQAYPHHTGGPQSKHIAHHLRRTSFLEDRKARLADRAAHAEKVRLRAALAKAAPRGTSSLEERALAAQQAREKKLAEIVASCAEDVRKAKAVAESMKEKREQELARVRARMEERMAEADRRREELKNRSAAKRARGPSVNNRKTGDVQSPSRGKRVPRYSEGVAAGKIQWWWRGMLRKKALMEFNELGLTVEGIRDTSFDHVVELLGQERVLLRTSRILRICGLREGDTGSVNEVVALRTFLSAFLILGHPSQVLSNKDGGTGEQEQVGAQVPRPLPHDDLANPQLQDLVAKARDLLICFENISSHLTAANNYTAPPTLQRSLPQVYATFHNAFIAWKSRDSDSLVQVMVMQFVELQMIWQTVKDSADGASAEVYRESIKDNQVKLIVRIKRLAGPERGKKLISEALRQAKQAHAAKKPRGDMKPRVMENNAEAAATATAESFAAPSPPQVQPLTPPATPSRVPFKPERPPQAIVLGPGLGGLLPDNRVVVHELAINQEYRIPPTEYREQRAASQRPIFVAMRFNLEAGLADDSFRCFAVMIRYFKDSLQRLVKPDGFMYKTIGGVLDVELAERQFRVGNFSYENFFAGISNLLPKLCAPYRDEECKDLIENKLQNGDLVSRVEALTEFVDYLLCDYVNYMLSMAAPQLIQSAPQYEAKRFAEAVEEKGLKLTAAVTAWRSARSKVLAETSKRDPEGINHIKSRPTADKFYAQMLVDLFTQPLPIDEKTVPEMLLLDYKRMQRLSLATQRIITAAAILLQCKNMLKRDVRSPWKTEATRVMTVLEADHEDVEATVQGTMAALEGGRSMPAVTKTHLKALVTKVVRASRDSTRQGEEPREPVLRLLLSRLRGHMFARLGAGSASEKIKAASTAGERLAGLGLAEFASQVREIVDEISRVGAVDRAAHGQWWEAVAAKVQQEDGSSSATSSTEG